MVSSLRALCSVPASGSPAAFQQSFVPTGLAAALVSSKQPSSCLSTTVGEVEGWASSLRPVQAAKETTAAMKAREPVGGRGKA